MTMAVITERVRSVLEQRGTACLLEEVPQLCPDLTWNQVFLAIDYLSRTGQVAVSTLDGGQGYRVQIPISAA
jgi:cytochrome oxidase assembly protein ShyY1